MSNAQDAAAIRGPKPRTRWLDALVLLAYVALSLAASWPLPLHLNTHIPGRQADARVFQWNNWWIQRALLAPKGPQNPLYTDRFYYPIGASLAGHNLNWVSSLLSVPLGALFGPTLAYNLLFMLTLWGSGFAAYLLVRYLLKRTPPQDSGQDADRHSERSAAESKNLFAVKEDPSTPLRSAQGDRARVGAAFVAGLVFAFYPYHLSGNWDGQMNLANTQWLPLAIWFLLRTVDHKRVRDALLCALFVALSGLDCWFFLPFLGLWGLVWLAYSLIWERQKWNGRLVGLLVGAALVSGLLIAPALWPVLVPSGREGLAETGQETVGEAVDYFAEHKASDLLALVVPSSDHPLLGEWADPAYDRFVHWRPAFMGYTVLLLALYATVRALLACRCEERSDKATPGWHTWGLLPLEASGRPKRRLAMTKPQALLWAASGALFTWLALGTTLRVGGVERAGAPMLLRWLIKVLPAFKLIRQPSRFNVMVGLSLSVLAGLACADLFSRLSRPRLRAGLGGLLAALILFEYLAWPCPLLPARVSPWYERLAQEPEDSVLVELPLGQLTSGHALYPQTVHGKRLVNGYVARAASDVNPFVLSSPLLKAFYLRIEPDPRLHDLPAALQALAANDVRAIVLRKGPLPPLPAVEADVMTSWRRTLGRLGLEPLYEDAEIAAFPTGPRLDQAEWPPAGGPAADMGDIELISLAARRVEHDGRHLLQLDLVWRAASDLDQDLDLALSVKGPHQIAARGGPWRISPHYPTSLWRQEVVVAERYALPLDPAQERGSYALALDLSGPDSAEAVHVEIPVELSAQARPLTAELDVPHLADVAFGEQMWLLGYRWEEGTLGLCWQALDVMGTNYKIFVHLLDEGGAIVAQVDTMPRGWSYPTTLWSRQELFCDRVPLPVQDLPAGPYRAALGVYRPEIGRLPAIDGVGRQIADDRVVLDAPLVISGP